LIYKVPDTAPDCFDQVAQKKCDLLGTCGNLAGSRCLLLEVSFRKYKSLLSAHTSALSAAAPSTKAQASLVSIIDLFYGSLSQVSFRDYKSLLSAHTSALSAEVPSAQAQASSWSLL